MTLQISFLLQEGNYQQKNPVHLRNLYFHHSQQLMQELITKSYNGFAIEFELIDGQLMANATAMCAAFDKRPAKWLELEPIKRYIAALEAKSDFRTSFIESRKGG